MILADSSAWIEYLRGTGSPASVAMRRFVEAGEDLCVTEPVVMEVLAGVRNAQDLASYRSTLLDLTMLPLGGLAGFEDAAAIYRRCRAEGEIIRSMVDCLVAVPAIRADASILHKDRDFDAIARHTELRVQPL